MSKGRQPYGQNNEPPNKLRNSLFFKQHVLPVLQSHCPEAKTVIDIGAGNGRIAAVFSENTALDVTAIDSQEYNEPLVPVDICSMEDYEGGPFDFVCLIGVAYVYQNNLKLIKEHLDRLTKEDGCVVISGEPQNTKPVTDYLREFGYNLLSCRRPDDPGKDDPEKYHTWRNYTYYIFNKK